MTTAVAIAYVLYRASHGFAAYPVALELGVVGLEAVFFQTSRDTLRKYYRRAAQVCSFRDSLGMSG